MFNLTVALRRLVLLTCLFMATMAVGDALTAGAASADTLGVTQSAASLPRGNPETLTFASNAGAISGGGGPYLYAVVQPTGAGACQSTYGSDLQVVGSQAVKLTPGANVQVNTGADSHSYNYTSYSPGSYTSCAWLETDSKDSSTENDTSSVVTATATSQFTVANTDSLAISFSSSTPSPGTPITATYNSQAAPIDSSGDGPYLFSVIQPTSAGACQSTYGTDLKVVGTQATALTPTTGVQLKTGADSHAYNYTNYTPGTYTVCGWVETDPKDSSTANDTSSVVTAASSANLTVVNPDTVTATVPSAATVAKQSFTLTVSGAAAPTDANGSAPFLYSVYQPVSVGGCGPTYGLDLAVARTQATVLAKGREVGTPTYTYGFIAKPAAGSYQVCSWLETDQNDSLLASDTAKVVLASNGPVNFTVKAAKVIPVPKLSASALSGLNTGKPKLTFTSVADSGTFKTIKVVLPAGLSLKSNAVLSKYVTVTSGKSIKHTVSHSGRTLTITFKASAKSVKVTVPAQALTETAALKKSVAAKKTTKATVGFTLTNTSGGVKKSSVKLKV